MGFDADAFNNANDQGGDAPPDGLYDVELYAHKFVRGRNDGRAWLLLTWVVLSGRERDRTFESWHTIDRYTKDGEDNSTAMRFTKELLAALISQPKVPPVRSEDELAQTVLEPSLHKSYEVEVKHSGIFANVYVKRALATVAPSLPGTGAAYGQSPAASGPSNAIYAGDEIASQSSAAEQSRRIPERTGESDVTKRGDAEQFARAGAPQRGSIDPETGEEIPF